MHPVFHSSELIPFESRELDPVGALPPRDGAAHPDLLPAEEQELIAASRFPFRDSALRPTQSASVDQQFGDRPTTHQAVDQSFPQASESAPYDLNLLEVEDTIDHYGLQAWSTYSLRV